MGMMNMGGSLRYDMSGRKRKNYKKNNPTVKRTENKSKPMKTQTNNVLEAHKEHMKKYPSMPMGKSVADGKGTKNHTWDMEKQQISSCYTVAPAYNNSAYLVKGKTNVKDIGK